MAEVKTLHGCSGFVEEINKTVSTLTEQLEKIRTDKKQIKKENLDSMMENVQNVRTELTRVMNRWENVDLETVPMIVKGDNHEDGVDFDLCKKEMQDRILREGNHVGPNAEDGRKKTHRLVKVMATDDSMSDDVFESDDTLKTPGVLPTQPSPTGYRGYKPPPDLFKDPYEDQELPHKTILLGDSGVGKTSLLVQFDTGKFQTGTFSATVGIGFTNKVVSVDEAKVKLQIWDTAGQERFRSVTHAYYRDAHALLLLYDVTNKISFDNIRAWLGEIREYAQDDVVIMLLGNKADCHSSERMIRKEDGERLAKEYSVTFMETSAKTGMNVELAFMAIARELKSRKCGNSDETVFNVQEYVREQTQKGSCPPCST